MKKFLFLALSLVFLAGEASAVTEVAIDVNEGESEGVYIRSPENIRVSVEGENPALDIPPIETKNLERDEQYRRLMNMKGKAGKRPTLSEQALAMRPKALEETAGRVGFQEGYQYRYSQIRDVLKKRETTLDAAFDFGSLLLENGKVMPPVIVFADSFSEIKSPNEMVETGVTYKILQPAKFVTVEPSWRDYLLVPDTAIQVEKIHPAMLPVNGEEQEIWRKALSEQWLNGMEYADYMFNIGVNRMLVDLRGIIQYKVLERQGYISMPQIARGHLAIRVGSENLEFDQQTFRITKKASFQNIERGKKNKVDFTKAPKSAQPRVVKRSATKKAPAKKALPKKPVAKKTPLLKKPNSSPKLTLPEKCPPCPPQAAGSPQATSGTPQAAGSSQTSSGTPQAAGSSQTSFGTPGTQKTEEIFLETQGSTVDITVKTNSDTVSPEDINIEIERQNRRANLPAAEPKAPATPESPVAPAGKTEGAIVIPSPQGLPSVKPEAPSAPSVKPDAPSVKPDAKPENPARLLPEIKIMRPQDMREGMTPGETAPANPGASGSFELG